MKFTSLILQLLFLSSLNPSNCIETCITKKKLIIDVDTSGLGNRLLGLTSSILLAVTLDRLLFLKWDRTLSCGSTFPELFIHEEERIKGPSVFYPDIMLNQTKPMIPITSVECRIRFSQHNKYAHFWFLRDTEMLHKLDNECDVIYIHTNQYYAPLLLENNFFGNELVKIFSDNPFPFVSKCNFKVRHRITQEAKELVHSKTQGGKWMAIHARGFYDSGKGVSKALSCANSLLSRGDIKHVFFSTESATAEDMAKKALPAEALIMTKKTLILPHEMKHEGHLIRHEMENALKDWYLLGKADYCMATTMDTSTFSQTSLSHGPCKYVSFRSGDKCNITNEAQKNITSFARQHIMAEPPISAEEKMNIWNSLIIETVTRNFPCEDGVTPISDGAVKAFWSYKDCKVH